MDISYAKTNWKVYWWYLKLTWTCTIRQQTTLTKLMELKWSPPMLFVSQIISSFQGLCGNTCCSCLPPFGLRIHSSLSNLTHIFDKRSTLSSGIFWVGCRSWTCSNFNIILRYLLHTMYYNVYFAVMTLKNEIPLEIWRRIRQQEESKKDCWLTPLCCIYMLL